MSHKLRMYAYNATDHTVSKYTITHTWDDIGDTLEGDNLKKGAVSHHKEIESGYTQYDWFTIIVDIDDDDIGSKSTDFYCNSSEDHKSVIISIHDDHVNCDYFTVKEPEKDYGDKWWESKDTGCMHKSYR